MATAPRLKPWSRQYEAAPRRARLEAIPAWIEEEERKPLRLRNETLIQRLHEEATFQAMLLAQEDPQWDFEHNFWLFGRDRRRTLLRMYRAQAALDAEVEAAKKENRRARIRVTKPRRVGSSLYWTLKFYQLLTRLPEGEGGLGAFIVAHEKETAEELYRRLLYALDNDPFHPVVVSRTKRSLEFANGCRLAIRSVGAGESLAAGFTVHFTLLTEVARYEEVGLDVEDFVNNLDQTMPEESFGFTLYVEESTGRGMANYFGRESVRKEREKPDDGVKQFFFPFWWRPDSTLPFKNKTERSNFLKTLEPFFIQHLAKHEKDGLTPEHVHWWVSVEKRTAKGHSDDERRIRCLRENPFEFMDCFGSAEKSTFSIILINSLRSNPRCRPPELRGEIITDDRKFNAPREFLALSVTPTPRFVPRSDGDLWIWRKPRIGHRYCSGLDQAKGTAQGDWSVMPVMDRDTMETVAMLYSKARNLALEQKARLLWKWYNGELHWHVPEVTQFGDYVDHAIETDMGLKLYQRPGAIDALSTSPQGRLGWLTSPTTKPRIPRAVEDAALAYPSLFTIPELLDEMQTYETTETARGVAQYGARHGDHDDIVTAFALMVIGHFECPLDGDSPRDLVKPKTISKRSRAWVLPEDTPTETATPPAYDLYRGALVP